jgi:uncharacterized heparinase superfamily protein
LISLYFHTIRYLKFKQIYSRILFNLISPKVDKSSSPNLRDIKKEFCLSIKKKVSLLNKDTFYFLDRSECLSKIGWNSNDDNISKLWRYNQHYFDDLNAIGSFKRRMWHNELLESWIDQNKIGEGVGWEPYPTSLRIVNWIKWYFSGNHLSDSFIKSLALQARWLNKRVEWHILGNHLFSNAKALVFAGLFFSSKESEIWLKKGLKIINDELNEQVLYDGGNFERSPMYHAIFLEDILDLINIAQTYPKVIQEKQVDEWIKSANSMIRWLEIMIHPDGKISFFNDATLEFAPNFDQLIEYMQRLGMKYSSSKFNKVTYLSNSGYVRFTSNNIVALLDVAPIGPDYLPGHAHADTLSFELSLFGQRLLVNCGTSEYEIGEVRQYERSTKAHNTVVVNGKNSSEVWSSFRVARRAYPFDFKIEELENLVNIGCAHDGYKRLTEEAIHRRNWQFLKSSVVIKDNIEGSFKNAFAYFHFHPLIKISKKQNNTWNIKISNGRQLTLKVIKGEPFIKTSYYAPKFGKRLNTQCLKIALDSKEGSWIQISWDNLNE